MFGLSKRSFENLNGVDAILIAIIVESIKNSPHDFGIPNDGGIRSAETQLELFKKGRKQINGVWEVYDKNKVVTTLDGYTKLSRHQKGQAFDIFGYKDGKATWDKTVLTEIAEHMIMIAKYKFNIDLTWGGDWRFKDLPHFQYP